MTPLISDNTPPQRADNTSRANKLLKQAAHEQCTVETITLSSFLHQKEGYITAKKSETVENTAASSIKRGVSAFSEEQGHF